MTGHPDWNPKHYESKRLRVTLDRSNKSHWSSDDLKLTNVDVSSAWNVGLHKARIKLLESGIYDEQDIDFKDIAATGATLLKPKTKTFCVTEPDWSTIGVTEPDWSTIGVTEPDWSTIGVT